jgi:hypothetical protein
VDSPTSPLPSLSDETRAWLPSLFIIGAAKCGTTSLHRYLAEHPEVCMSSEKEPMCFEPLDWVERLDDYRDLFERPARVRGEASTAYAAYPWVPEIPDRIRGLVPDARIIYMVREPIGRTVSHYAQNVWDRFPVRPFEELMEDLEEPMNMPVWCSRYATQLERYLERFPSEHILVLDQHDLQRDRAATMHRVFEFLEVEPSFTSPAWDIEHNTAGHHRVPRPWAHRLRRLERPAMRVPPLRRLLTHEIPKPVLTPGQRARLVGILEPEARRFRQLTGMKLDHWPV